MALKSFTVPSNAVTKHKPAVIKKSGHTRVKSPQIPLDMPGWYSTGNIMAVTGWSHSTLYNRIKEGKFPPPNKSGALNFWDTATVRDALGL